MPDFSPLFTRKARPTAKEVLERKAVLRQMLTENPKLPNTVIRERLQCTNDSAHDWKAEILAELYPGQATPGRPRKQKAPVLSVEFTRIYQALEHNCDLSPMELAARAGCGLETAKQARAAYFTPSC
jgi:hypothetical protein